jgi:PAS domain S-box-containing protein
VFGVAWELRVLLRFLHGSVLKIDGNIWVMGHIASSLTGAPILRQIIASNAMGMFLDDPSGRILDANDAFLLLVGYAREDLEQGRLNNAAITPAEHAPSDQAAMAEMRRTGRHEPYEKEILRKDGTRVLVLVSTSYLGGPDELFLRFIHDLTERRRAEEARSRSAELEVERARAEDALRDSAATLAAIGEAAPDFLWVTNASGEVVYINRQWYEYTGQTPEELRAQGYLSVIHPEERELVRSRGGEARVAALPFEGEFRYRRKDGEYRWFWSRSMPLCGPKGELVKRVGIAVDVTERRKLDAELRDVDQRKDELLTMLAHELRNPLGPIRNATQILRNSGPKDELIAKLRDVIERQTAHMARLIDDLLDVSRITRGKIMLQRDLVNLNDLVRNVVDDHLNAFESNRIGVALSLPEEPLWVHGDATRIEQCLGNLLSNAQKFSSRGGRVRVGLRLEGDASVLSVEDDGAGMDPELLGRLWKPFTQADKSLDRSSGGLGLGLALVKGLIELHGGAVHAESLGKGRGSTFTLRLPTAPAPARRYDEPLFASPSEKRRIVIIEDNIDAAESLCMLLSMVGHDVSTAATGTDGINLVRAERPDVVICDIGLPGGVTGYDVARAIRASAKRGPYLIALTGYGRDDDKKRAADAGFDVHLTKPIAPATLELLIAEWTTKIDNQPESGELG